MFKVLFTTFILLLCNKTYEEDYKPFTPSGRIELLGAVILYNNSTYSKNDNGTWIFMSIIIPELVKGNINAHSDDVDEIFNKIAITRQDIAARFGGYFYKTTQSFRISLMCVSGLNFIDIPQFINHNTTTGGMSLFIQCYKNGTKLVGLPELINSTAPLKSKTPVNCYINKSNCTEGYCVMFERKVFLGETNLVSVIQDYYCPNDFYNFLNFESANNIFVASYTTTVLNAAQICMEFSSNGNVNIHGKFSFFWWVSCYYPILNVERKFLPLPDFPETNSTNIYPSIVNESIRSAKVICNQILIEAFIMIFVISYYIN